MGKLNALSFVVFFIALITQVTDYIIEYAVEPLDHYFFDQFLQLSLLVIVGGPVVGIILGLYGKRGNLRRAAITLNAFILIAFGPLALLNLWITTFGIW